MLFIFCFSGVSLLFLSLSVCLSLSLSLSPHLSLLSSILLKPLTLASITNPCILRSYYCEVPWLPVAKGLSPCLEGLHWGVYQSNCITFTHPLLHTATLFPRQCELQVNCFQIGSLTGWHQPHSFPTVIAQSNICLFAYSITPHLWPRSSQNMWFTPPSSTSIGELT